MDFHSIGGTSGGSGGGGGGSAAVPASTPLCIGASGTGSNTNWANSTMWSGVYSASIIQPNATKFKVRLAAVGGTGISISSAYLVATARGSALVLASPAPVQITFNSGSASYAVPFSGASGTNPFYLDSDSLGGSIDNLHDWYIAIYLNADGTGYNAALSTYLSGGAVTGLLSTGLGGNHMTSALPGGDVPALSTAGNPLCVLLMAG
jgi:hypothetical protein